MILVLFLFRKVHVTDLECFVQIADFKLHLALWHLHSFLYCFGFRCFHSGGYLMDSFPDFAPYKSRFILSMTRLTLAASSAKTMTSLISGFFYPG